MKRAHKLTPVRHSFSEGGSARTHEHTKTRSSFFCPLSLFGLLCLCLQAPSGAWAQTLPEKLEARYASFIAWSADFEQTTYIDMLDQKTVKDGQIAVMRPSRVRVAYTTTPAKVYVSDGKKLWVYKESGTEAWQFDKPKKVISEEAWSFLSGLSNLSQIFTVIDFAQKDHDTLTIKNTGLKKIVLIPKQPDSVLKLIVGVNEKTLLISEAVLYNTSGNVTHYLFKNVELNPALEDTFFTLPAEPKRKIIKK